MMRLVQQSFTRWHLSLQEKEKMCVRVIFRDGLVQSLLSEVTPDEQDAKKSMTRTKLSGVSVNRLFISSAKEKKQRHFISNIFVHETA